MKQTMDLNKMGLMPMSEVEMQETDGGFWDELALWAVKQIIINWDQVKAGFKAGYNSTF